MEELKRVENGNMLETEVQGGQSLINQACLLATIPKENYDYCG